MDRELLALARGGVYRARFVTEAAVRSYRTLSPLPVSRERDHRRSTLCGTSPDPAIEGRWTLSITVSYRVRTFLAFLTNRNPRPSVHTHIVRHGYTACMAKASTSMVAWIAPEQAELLADVAKTANMKLIAVGTSNQTDATTLATKLKAEQCNDLRSMVTHYDDAVLWIGEPGAYDISLCEILRHRSKVAVTTTPLSGSMDELVAEAGQSPAAKFVPLMRRSAGYGEAADDIEQFGQPTSAHCTMLCSNVEGTLWSRLFDAMDFIDQLFGTPESVHAFLEGGKVPDEPSELRGHMTVNLQFQQQKCATMLLSDQAPWKREMQMIGNGHAIVIDDGGKSPATLIADGITATLSERQTLTTADAPRILALCEAARMSCLTGSSEHPHRVLEMF